MKKNRLPAFASLLFFFLLPFLLHAEVKLPSIFTDNMVLQQQAQVPLWGWAKAGSNVSVTTSWNGKKYSTKADGSGKWKLKVATPAAGGPFELTISDGTPLSLKNV